MFYEDFYETSLLSNFFYGVMPRCVNRKLFQLTQKSDERVFGLSCENRNGSMFFRKTLILNWIDFAQISKFTQAVDLTDGLTHSCFKPLPKTHDVAQMWEVFYISENTHTLSQTSSILFFLNLKRRLTYEERK